MAKGKTQEKSTKIKGKSISANSTKPNKGLQFSMNLIIAIVCIVIAIWFGFKGYLETRVNTPYDVEKVCIIT
jgi:mannosyl-oligosaccharide glucosidase